MASLMVLKEIMDTQTVEPIELNYVNQGAEDGAIWVLPTKEHPTAYLKEANTIDVTGEVDRKVKPSAKQPFLKLTVEFELSLSPRSYGFKDANVQFGVKLTEEGKYEYESVQEQIAKMKHDDEKTWVIATFLVNGHVGPLGGKVYFQLKDTTAKVLKGGLTLYKARVTQLGPSN